MPRSVARRSALGYSSSQGRLLSTLLAAIADFERDLIVNALEKAGSGLWLRAPSSAGLESFLTTSDRKIKRRADGETLAAISKSYAVSIAMISRL